MHRFWLPLWRTLHAWSRHGSVYNGTVLGQSALLHERRIICFGNSSYNHALISDSDCLCDAPYMLDPDTGLCTTEQCSDGVHFCMDGGSCNAAGTGCECPDGVTGDHCENSEYINIDSIIWTCWNLSNLLKLEFVGDHCENNECKNNLLAWFNK